MLRGNNSPRQAKNDHPSDTGCDMDIHKFFHHSHRSADQESRIHASNGQRNGKEHGCPHKKPCIAARVSIRLSGMLRSENVLMVF